MRSSLKTLVTRSRTKLDYFVASVRNPRPYTFAFNERNTPTPEREGNISIAFCC